MLDTILAVLTLAVLTHWYGPYTGEQLTGVAIVLIVMHVISSVIQAFWKGFTRGLSQRLR